MPQFSNRVENAVTSLSENGGGVDENEFIDASRLGYDGVREIRRAVLLNRGDEGDMDSDIESEGAVEDSEVGSVRPQVESRQEGLIDEYPDISGITTAREAMKKLPEEEKQKIAQQVEVFKTEKLKFDKEVRNYLEKLKNNS